MGDELQNEEQLNQSPESEEELELSHTDKLVGVFTEPGETFTAMSKHPVKVVDWILPVLALIIVAALSNFVLMSNPNIKYQVIQQQMERIEQQFNEMVDKGQMTREQADQQLERTRQFMENQAGAGMIFQIIGIVVVVFLTFFIVSGVFFLTAKFGLKGDGNYSSAMVSYGLPFYISIIQIIVMVIAAWILEKFLTGTSVASFMGMEPQKDFVAMLLSKIDPFSIWFYAIVSIAYAKMFKAESTKKYFIAVFGLWIGFSIILFFVAQAVPFLQNFIR